MTKQFAGIFALLFLTTGLLTAQEFGYGFRTGLNFNQFRSNTTMGPNGEPLETFGSASGFHLAAAFSIKFTDLVGLRPELVYSQRGGTLEYDGPGYLAYFDGQRDFRVIEGGNRRQSIDVTNSFIDLPVVFYYRPVSALEIFGGAYVGATINSTGAGTITYTTAEGEEVVTSLDLNYFRDEPGDTDFAGGTEVETNGGFFNVPQTFTAYYDQTDRDDRQFDAFDFGLVGGLAIYLNEGLFISGRVQYGLTDVTEDEYEVSLQSLNADNSFISTARDVNYLTIQASIGFGF